MEEAKLASQLEFIQPWQLVISTLVCFQQWNSEGKHDKPECLEHEESSD